MFKLGPNKMYKKVKEDGCVFFYEVNITEEKIKEIENNALLKIQSIAAVPGFRTGKAPLNIIKQQFSSVIKDEVLDIAAKTLLNEIISREKIFPVVNPGIMNINYEPSKKISFTLRLECNPIFEPKKYEKIEVIKKIHKITDEDVEKHLNILREYNAYLKTVEDNVVVNKNHYVVVDYDMFENGNKINENSVRGEIIDMSSPQNIAGMADAILGAQKGEEKEFETEFDNKKVKFKVKILEIKEKIVPELDDNFIKQSGVNTIDELKAQIKKILQAQEIEKSEKDVIKQIEDSLIKDNKFPLPPTILDEEIKELFEILKKRSNIENQQSIDIKDYISTLKPIAERNLTITYLLHNIAKKENISATNEDFQNEMNKVISSLKSEDERKRARDIFETRKDYIMASILENKTFDFIKSKAEIKEVEV